MSKKPAKKKAAKKRKTGASKARLPKGSRPQSPMDRDPSCVPRLAKAVWQLHEEATEWQDSFKKFSIANDGRPRAPRDELDKLYDLMAERKADVQKAVAEAEQAVEGTDVFVRQVKGTRPGQWSSELLEAMKPVFYPGMAHDSTKSNRFQAGLKCLLAEQVWLEDNFDPSAFDARSGEVSYVANREGSALEYPVEAVLAEMPEIPIGKIEGFLRDVKVDIEDHLSPKAKPRELHVESEDERDRRLFGGLFEPHERTIRWLEEVGLLAPMNWGEMWAIRDEYNIPEQVIGNALEIVDTMDSLNSIDDVLIATIKNDRKSTAPVQESRPASEGRAEEINDTPVTLREFMKMFCAALSKNISDSRVKALQSAARRREITLPKHEGHWKSGKSKKYRPTALMREWPKYREVLPNLPELKRA